MKHTNKMVLVPYQDGSGEMGGEDSFTPRGTVSPPSPPQANPSKRNSIRKYAADRQRKMLTIVLKLALTRGYDEGGMMKTMDGDEMDIIPLLIYTLSPGRNIAGIHDFIELLYQAGVKPHDVINVHVRDLLNRRSRRTMPQKTYSRPPRPPSPPRRPPMSPPVPEKPPRTFADEYQLPPDEIMDERTKRVFDDVDDSSEDHSKRVSHKRGRNDTSSEAIDWDAHDSDLDNDL